MVCIFIKYSCIYLFYNIDGDRPHREYTPRGDGEYRRRDDGEKKEGAAGDYKPEFVSLMLFRDPTTPLSLRV